MDGSLRTCKYLPTIHDPVSPLPLPLLVSLPSTASRLQAVVGIFEAVSYARQVLCTPSKYLKYLSTRATWPRGGPDPGSEGADPGRRQLLIQLPRFFVVVVVAAGRAGDAPCRVEGPWTLVPGLSVRGH